MTTPTRKSVTVPMLQMMKSAGEKIVMVTAYDSTFARIVDDAGVDAILVGDSVATVMQGYTNTIPVTLNEMAYHTALVRRAQPKALVVGDLPFGSYQVGAGQGIESSVVLMKAGAQCVKLEGGTTVATTIEAITRADIPSAFNLVAAATALETSVPVAIIVISLPSIMRIALLGRNAGF